MNLYTGEIISKFTVENESVEVHTVCNQQTDAIGVQVFSSLLAKGRLKISMRFPFPTDSF